jgi:hypothetical protein
MEATMHDWERYRSSAAASRVSHFRNKFRELGFIDYNGSMEVHSSLLSVVLHDHRISKSERKQISNAPSLSQNGARRCKWPNSPKKKASSLVGFRTRVAESPSLGTNTIG